MQSSARAHQSSLELILQHCPSCIVSITDNLVIRYANEAASQLLNHDLAELSGKSLLNYLPGLKSHDNSAFGQPTASELLLQLSTDGTQIEALVGDDKSIFVEIDLMSIGDSKESVQHLIVLRDMTSLNGSLSNIFRTHRELEDFNRLAVGRELRMVELKAEVNELLAELGRPSRYQSDS